MPYSREVHINKWLLPLSWLYGFIVFIRNKLFDWDILKQKEYDIPVISIGNITVGGTGKTPHSEYLVELLRPYYKIAVLSRGYKRKTKDFMLASRNSTVEDIGDEAFQMWSKYPDIIVAVDTSRQRGIETLLSLPDDARPEIILLDDAFQHRYVKPSYSILLTDFNRLMSKDKLLPAGRLREPVDAAEKANMIIVTKCPIGLNPLEQRLITKYVKVFPYQELFYTTFQYGMITPLFNLEEEPFSLGKLKDVDVLLVTGIVNPRPLQRVIKKHTRKIVEIKYPDHHSFSKKDLTHIKSTFDNMPGSNKMIITTEKDAARLLSNDGLDSSLKKSIHYIPIKVKFINPEDQDIFNTKILEHVREYPENN